MYKDNPKKSCKRIFANFSTLNILNFFYSSCFPLITLPSYFPSHYSSNFMFFIMSKNTKMKFKTNNQTNKQERQTDRKTKRERRDKKTIPLSTRNLFCVERLFLGMWPALA